MLTFDEKLRVIESFPELERKNVSLGRINFQFNESILEKKNVVYHLHPNGNGFVFAGHLTGYTTDDKGFVNIRDFSAEDLFDIIRESIHGLSPRNNPIEEEANDNGLTEERWTNQEKDQLILIFENEAWNIYYGLNLDATFDTYEEAKEFLVEEGFHKA